MIDKAKYSSERLKANVLLALLVVVLFFVNYYNQTLFFRPSSIHQWRQADCLSITKNYYEEGMHFFEPKIHFQGGMQGKAVSECPILNYSVAALWKLFGEHEFIYRLLEYLIFITAVFVFFNSLFRNYPSLAISFFGACFLLTSPLLVYYSLNFIADVPALSLAIICFCLLYNFYQSKRQRDFYLALIVGTLSVLIKASALVPLSLLFLFSLIDLANLNRLFGLEKMFNRKVPAIVALLVSLGLILGWYNYAIYYNNNNKNNVFLLTVLPIWYMGEEELLANLKLLFNTHFPIFLNRPMFFLLFTLVVYVIARFRQLDAFLKYSFLAGALFFVAYLFFFFQVFNVHDYYLSNLMIFPVITLFCASHLIAKTSFIQNNKGFITFFLVCFILFNAMHAAAVYRLRMIKDDKLTYWFPFISEDDLKFAEYYFWEYSTAVKKIEDFRPALRQHNIKREDKVVSIPDQSFDISLYFMDQKGFTIARHHFKDDSLVLKNVLENDIDYVVMSDTVLKREPAFKKVANELEPFFVENSVQVFKVRKGN